METMETLDRQSEAEIQELLADLDSKAMKCYTQMVQENDENKAYLVQYTELQILVLSEKPLMKLPEIFTKGPPYIFHPSLLLNEYEIRWTAAINLPSVVQHFPEQTFVHTAAREIPDFFLVILTIHRNVAETWQQFGWVRQKLYDYIATRSWTQRSKCSYDRTRSMIKKLDSLAHKIGVRLDIALNGFLQP